MPAAALGSIGIYSHPRGSFGSSAHPEALRAEQAAAAGHDMELVDMKGSKRAGSASRGSAEHKMADVHVELPGDEPAAAGSPDTVRASHRARSNSDSAGREAAVSSSPGAPRVWPSVLRDGWKVYWLRSLREVFLSTKSNWLLLAIPVKPHFSADIRAPRKMKQRGVLTI